MICEQERKKLLAAKSLYMNGTISYEILFRSAEEYHQALLDARKLGARVGGKPLWVPRHPGRLIGLTK